MQTLLGKDDIVVSDQLNHASIIDAVKVAGVQNKFRYNHSDMGDLETQLIAASELQHSMAKVPALRLLKARLAALAGSALLAPATASVARASRRAPQPFETPGRRLPLTPTLALTLTFDHAGRRRPRRMASTL